jgi:hypothetical protein
MTAQEYITGELQKLSQPIELVSIGDVPLEEAIFAKVMSKKFRKWKVDEDAISLAKNAISYAVAHNQPVQIGLLFGGNKLWRFDEAPEIDWSELFSLMHYARWMKSIASVYEPGVSFGYYSQDVSVERLNNLERSETGRYAETFTAMLEWLSAYLPENIKVTYRRHSEVVDGAAYDAELESGVQQTLEASGGKLPDMTDSEKRTTELNVRLRPGQDQDPQWHEKVELQHRAIFVTKSLLPYLSDHTTIACTAMPYPGYLAIGSTKRSIAKFWASVGVLEKDNDSFHTTVLSPKQLAAAHFTWQDVSIDGLSTIGKNFSKVRVVHFYGGAEATSSEQLRPVILARRK